MTHVSPAELLWPGQECGLCILGWDERDAGGVEKSSRMEPEVR